MATHSSVLFLGNPMDRGAWQVAKSQTQLSDFHFHIFPPSKGISKAK